ncbi:metal-dependent transcriptional regulator [Flavobacterium sp.]|uniref:metal-dependent transcriptional regulator n=1 Tax=Flavobacterium sp. TaxID=239 RepID=UPI0028BEC149|nr:metal-dependent transcriptional regulator [Flavobacterium sp.]
MTYSEENYLKAIYHLSQAQKQGVSTNAIAALIESKASSVTDMIKKLADKDLVNYQKYQGVRLTDKGLMAAKMIVRKHRLWEVFLVEKLDFTWDEVHDVAEELEHIKSEKLINKLDAFLGFPTEDPHGDPIPDKNGNIVKVDKQLLSDFEVGQTGICVGVKDSSSSFLQYLDKHQISLGTTIRITDKESFDNTLQIEVDGKTVIISHKIASNLYIK